MRLRRLLHLCVQLETLLDSNVLLRQPSPEEDLLDGHLVPDQRTLDVHSLRFVQGSSPELCFSITRGEKSTTLFVSRDITWRNMPPTLAVYMGNNLCVQVVAESLFPLVDCGPFIPPLLLRPVLTFPITPAVKPTSKTARTAEISGTIHAQRFQNRARSKDFTACFAAP